jgi:hypothetical protein
MMFRAAIDPGQSKTLRALMQIKEWRNLLGQTQTK